MAAYAAAVSLRIVLERLLKHFDIVINLPSLEMIEFAYNEVKSFEEFITGLDISSRKRMTASLGQSAEAVCEFNKVLKYYWEKEIHSLPAEGIEDKTCSKLFSMTGVQVLKQRIHSLAETFKRVEEEYTNGLANLLPEEKEVVSSKVVGLSDQYKKLKQSAFEHWRTMSLVGMPGIGKTTLAKKIFQDLDILEWFECRAWVDVGRRCQSEENILRAILAQVDQDAHKMLGERDEEIGGHLEERLRGKRYIIVLDDVWEEQIYRHLERFLPDEDIGSKVLLTTRVQDVAEDDVILPAFILNVRLLNKKESWDLLREKVFGEESCPSHLEKAGKKIVEHCYGLPLTIVTISDFLSKAKKTPEDWSEIASQKNHQIFMATYEEISKVLYSSYEELSQQLKLCLMYIGVFPPNYGIPRSKLINLWITEEFLEPEIPQCLENYAFNCLEELVSKNLVVDYQTSSTISLAEWKPQVKTCGLHSSWWYLCYKEARKHNLFYILNNQKDGLGEGIQSQIRLCIHNNILLGITNVFNSLEGCCASTARFLLCYGPYHKYPVPICFGLRSLQNLDAVKVRLYEFPLEVIELVQLRYLALTCNGKLPSSISKLEKLQFLIVHQHLSIKSPGSLSYLPMEIWDMKELKHIHITGSHLPDPICDNLLPILITLIDVNAHSCTKSVFERIPNLNKLGVRIELAPDAAKRLSCFDHISHLKKLDTLKCAVVNSGFSSEAIPPPAFSNLPLCLRKLSLSGLGYPWEEMSKIASLPGLKVLKLQCNAFRGSKWEIEEDRFIRLRYLLIEDTDVEQLKVGKGSFQFLGCLIIQHCYKLKEVDWMISPTLSKIDIVDCNPLVEEQMKKAMFRKSILAGEFRVQSSWNNEKLKL